jgi:sterol desaturase/sphingolipid hydroxylase (fatty acid hydroxylase superfamily)
MALLRLWAWNFAWDLGRYLVAAGALFVLVWIVWRERLAHRLIGKWASSKDMKREIAYSLSTAIVFSIIGTIVKLGTGRVFRMYEGIGSRGWAWFFFSIVVLVVLQDTYFYWTHRAMHHRWLFKRFHRAHHLSHNPSPWAAYAFSPLEALVQAIYVPLVLLVLPVHELALFAFLLFMITRNVVGHAGVELFPRGFVRGPLRVVSTTTTHHALHHRRADVNYGLYFPWWDWVMKTTHPSYEATFDEVTHPLPKKLGARVV